MSHALPLRHTANFPGRACRWRTTQCGRFLAAPVDHTPVFSLGENAIAKNREVMGATNPANAAEGTIRKVHALSIGENSVHGSDAPETAAEEIAYWFSGTEIVG